MCISEIKVNRELSSPAIHFPLFCVQCEPISGLGFSRGSYVCRCEMGFYFPDKLAYDNGHAYFNGNTIEQEFEKRQQVKANTKGHQLISSRKMKILSKNGSAFYSTYKRSPTDLFKENCFFQNWLIM
jgi:hypothetical protein